MSLYSTPTRKCHSLSSVVLEMRHKYVNGFSDLCMAPLRYLHRLSSVVSAVYNASICLCVETQPPVLSMKRKLFRSMYTQQRYHVIELPCRAYSLTWVTLSELLRDKWSTYILGRAVIFKQLARSLYRSRWPAPGSKQAANNVQNKAVTRNSLGGGGSPVPSVSFPPFPSPFLSTPWSGPSNTAIWGSAVSSPQRGKHLQPPDIFSAEP